MGRSVSVVFFSLSFQILMNASQVKTHVIYQNKKLVIIQWVHSHVIALKVISVRILVMLV